MPIDTLTVKDKFLIVKMFMYIFILLTSGSILFSQNSLPKFDPSNLTKEEKENCRNFRKKEGQPRWDEFQKIRHLLPNCPWGHDSSGHYRIQKGTLQFLIMKKQLFKLFGKPDLLGFAYKLGKKQFFCDVYIEFENTDTVFGFTYVNCAKYSPEMHRDYPHLPTEE